MSLTLALIGLASAEPVVVASRWIPPGTTLAAEDLRTVDVPYDEGIQPGSTPEAVIGRVTIAPILEGDVVVEERLAFPESRRPGALVPRGLSLVRVPLARPTDGIEPWSWVDLVRVGGTGACYAAQGVHVIAVERPGGAVTSDPRDRDRVSALLVAVSSEALPTVSAIPPERLAVLVRSPIEAGTPGTRCDPAAP